MFAAGAGRAPAPYSHKGSIDEWRQQVAALCVGNPLLLFATSAAFAGPLLELIGAESGGFHVYGNSSQGKSTLLHMVSSVFGKPEEFCKSWRLTDNAAEGIARAYADTLLPLDEIKECDPRIIDQTIYMLGNSKGKARATDTGGLRKAASWRLLFFSTGEMMEPRSGPSTSQSMARRRRCAKLQITGSELAQRIRAEVRVASARACCLKALSFLTKGLRFFSTKAARCLASTCLAG